MKELFHAALDEGRPRLVAVSGVAGVGKSRLGWEFEKYVDGLREVVCWHRGRALSYGDGVTFWPFAEMMRYRLGIVDGDPPDEVEAKLDAGLADLVPDASERAWLRPRLAALLGVGDGRAGHRVVVRPRGPVRQLDRVPGTGRRPTASAIVLVFDDMQYAESGLLDFLDHLLDAARFPLFVLTLARPELLDARPGWGVGRRVTPIYLEPLLRRGDGGDRRRARRRAAARRRARPSWPGPRGIPLYALETVRALIDRDAVVPRDGRYVLADDAADRVDLETLSAPPSLLALIAARLDALTGRRAPRRAGRHRARPHVLARRARRASPTSTALDEVLDELVRKEIFAVHVDRFSPERGQYRFVQALVRTVAYDTLSRRDRKARHLAAAAYLLETTGDELTAIVARHYLDAIDSRARRSRRGRAHRDRGRAARAGGAAGRGRRFGRGGRAPLPRRARPRPAARGAGPAARGRRPRRAGARSERRGDRAGGRRPGPQYAALGLDVDAGRGAAPRRARRSWPPGRVQAAVELMAAGRTTGLAGKPGADASRARRWPSSWHGPTCSPTSPSGRQPYADRALQLAEAAQDWDRVVAMLSRQSTIWLSRDMPIGGIALLRAAIDLGRQHHLPNALIIPLTNL